MSQTLAPSIASVDRAAGTSMRGRMTWASPGDDLWVASLTDTDGVHFLGFVERSLDAFIAVDGAGASKGRHADLLSAKAAVERASAPVRDWSETGAAVLTVRALRAR